jgi:hypothetical protein
MGKRLFSFPKRPQGSEIRPASYAMDNGSVSLDVRLPQFEADRLPQFSTEVKNESSYAFTPPTYHYGLYRENVYKHYKILCSLHDELNIIIQYKPKNAHFLN